MATYSIAVTGARADNPQAPLVGIDDSVARRGAQERACRTGEQFLVRFPDGSDRWCVYDSSRTVPATGPLWRVVLPVGP